MDLGNYYRNIQSGMADMADNGDDDEEFTGGAIVDIFRHAGTRYQQSEEIQRLRDAERLKALEDQRKDPRVVNHFDYSSGKEGAETVKTALVVGGLAFGGIVLLLWMARKRK